MSKRRALAQLDRSGESQTARLKRRAAVMAAFTARPGELLETDQVAAATHYPPGLVRSIAVDLTASGWLQSGRSPRGKAAWRRVNGHQAPTPAEDQPPEVDGLAPGATRPGVRRFFCKQCRRGVTSPDPPHAWLRVQVRDDALARRNGQTYATAGLFCSVACLAAWATTTSAEPTT